MGLVSVAEFLNIVARFPTVLHYHIKYEWWMEQS